MSARGVTVGVIGIDHRHIFGMLGGMLDAGATCKGWWSPTVTGWEDGFAKRFPDVPRVGRYDQILDDPDIDLVLLAGVPDQRARDAADAMVSGKDVMVDKPGCVTLDELAQLRDVARDSGRIWTVNFSERFEVPAVAKATELVRAGAIGKVVHTTGLGPHRLNRPTRKPWFFERARYGGILCDIGSHQVDQFLHFTGSTDAQVTFAAVGNHANPADPGLQDFGHFTLQGDGCHGYARLDWYTPDALPTWGDGRLVLLGTAGYIELRKYVDVGGHVGTDHLLLVNGDRCERIGCQDVQLTYFADLARGVAERSWPAAEQEHAFTATRLALEAQRLAERQPS